ncbi:MAG: hypothetical protein EZS28_021887 [Streblomastix strix]|uniref:Protein kinase domain-containing protein n=1 Tax=Streblomastix strix TaxID=222440 RepID=A0A5J4VIV7_9EUKA|nr:MAG: hypothetical protein EZS28_021887 [Streblomastix strix]
MADYALLDEYKEHVETPLAQLLSLADFTNLKPISQDGFGRSYSATFLQTGQEVILKRMNFLNEAEEQAINHEIEIHRSMQFRFIASPMKVKIVNILQWNIIKVEIYIITSRH